MDVSPPLSGSLSSRPPMSGTVTSSSGSDTVALTADGAGAAQAVEAPLGNDPPCPPLPPPPTCGGVPHSNGTLREAAVQSPKTTLTRRRIKHATAPTTVLLLFVSMKIITSYDSGAFSASLGGDNGIAIDMGLNPAEGGALGSSVFLGNLCGCLLCGSLFGQHSAKSMMLIGMSLHALTTLLFAISQSFEVAMVVRFCLGVTIAFPVVYSPMWVEEHAPAKRRTTWMALCNAGVPIGTMFGFVVGGLLPSLSDFSWRWAFHFKVIAMIPCLAAIAQCDPATFDQPPNAIAAVLGQPPAEEAVGFPLQTAHPDSFTFFDHRVTDGYILHRFLVTLKRFLSNKMFVANVAALCVLYFIVTALQTFITVYLRAPPFNAEMATIVAGFGTTVVTAPVFGVIGGGLLVDKLGGYHRSWLVPTKVMLGWGVACAVFSVITIFAATTATFLLCTWILMFCGGAIVPVATGLIMASVDEDERSLASSLSVVMFNLFGYFLGPIVCGAVADVTSMAWGIRSVLLLAIPGIAPMLWAWRIAVKQSRGSLAGTASLNVSTQSAGSPDRTLLAGSTAPPPSAAPSDVAGTDQQPAVANRSSGSAASVPSEKEMTAVAIPLSGISAKQQG